MLDMRGPNKGSPGRAPKHVQHPNTCGVRVRVRLQPAYCNMSMRRFWMGHMSTCRVFLQPECKTGVHSESDPWRSFLNDVQECGYADHLVKFRAHMLGQTIPLEPHMT